MDCGILDIGEKGKLVATRGRSEQRKLSLCVRTSEGMADNISSEAKPCVPKVSGSAGCRPVLPRLCLGFFVER